MSNRATTLGRVAVGLALLVGPLSLAHVAGAAAPSNPSPPAPLDQAATTTAVEVQVNPAHYDYNDHFLAFVTSTQGTPTGTVQFEVTGEDFGAPVSLTGGKAMSEPTSTLTTGTYSVSAVYLGSARFLSSGGALATSFVIRPETVSFSISCGTNNVPYSIRPTTLTCTATAHANAKPVTGGQITLQLLSGTPRTTPTDLIDVGSGPAAPVEDGAATVSYALPAGLTPGYYPFRYDYTGTNDYVTRTPEHEEGTGAINIVKAPTSITLSSSSKTGVVGQPFFLTVTVSSAYGTPTGEVSIAFVVHTKTVKAEIPLVDGTRTVTLSTLPWGGYTVSVTYPGSPHFQPAAKSYHFSILAPARGYDLVGSDGGVFVFDAPGQPSGYHGSLPALGIHPAAPIVGMVPTVDNGGYFLVGSDGGVFAFGTAPFLGSLPGIGVHPSTPITGLVATDTDRGYFLVGSDGGVFAFGTAPFLGSLPEAGIDVDNVVGIAATPTGEGYWLLTSTGGVYGFGKASIGLRTLRVIGTKRAATVTSPAAAIAGTATGGGFWIVTQDGAVYAAGKATNWGGLPAVNITPALPIVGIVPTSETVGYLLFGADGGIFACGFATYYGSLPGLGIQVSDIVGAVPN